jgi:uncharacterized repeat protein (TIGR03803 family)
VAQAQTETVLFTFTGVSTGYQSYAGLAIDKEGNLYGTATGGGGGSITCSFFLGSPGCGLVFKVSPAGKETALHSFAGGADGSRPFYGSNVTVDEQGNLYGATPFGGVGTFTFSGGNGVVYKIESSGKETVLYGFPKSSTGETGSPNGGLVLDAEGNLYGTTQYGGAANGPCGSGGCGVVYKLDPTGNQTVLYSFAGGPDAANPNCCLVRDAAGNLYGSAGGGSSYSGTVYKLSPTGSETVVYTFTGGTDGGGPNGGLFLDKAGNLYGTTSGGGLYGSGTVFKVSQAGTETVLYNFTGGNDGGFPTGSLIADAAGNLYGTTLGGGIGGFTGVVFKLDPTLKETVLYSFTGGADGGNPVGNLVRDKLGNLYGVTNSGGRACGGFPSCGVVFKLAPQ